MEYSNPLPVIQICLAVVALPGAAISQPSYTETFETTTYMDAVATTADWNTEDGELKLLPFVPYEIGLGSLLDRGEETA